MEKQHLYIFGDFRLDLKEKTLTSNGINISITPKVFLLLKALVENHGLIVEKDELMKQVWEDSFVEESNLTYNIRQLRKILNDDFNHPKFIETIPRRGYRFIGEVQTVQPNPTEIPVKILNSIAVLPFANLSEDAENEYFCDGLAEELLNALAKIGQLKVAARTSSFAFKNKNININEIGRALNVQTVLEGSVRKSENKLRITAQLINTADGFHLWSECYERELQDIFEIQDEITNAIVDVLKVNLLGRAKPKIFKQYTANIEAYQLYLKGLHHYNNYSSQELQKAIEYFEQAIAADSKYVSAYVWKGFCNTALWYYSYLPPEKTIPHWKFCAKKALQIDNDSAEAHLSRAGLYFTQEWDWENAEKEYLRSISLSPNFAQARWRYGLYLTTVQRFDEATIEAEKAIELDPLSVIVTLYVGYIYLAAERFEKVFELVNRMNEITPNFYGTYHLLGRASLAVNQYSEAIEAFQKSLALGGGKIDLSGLGTALALAGKRDEALAVANQIIKAREIETVPALNLARVYFGLGDNDSGFEWLEKAIDEHNAELVYLHTSVKFGDFRENDFRQDVRFKKCLKKIGFPMADEIEQSFSETTPKSFKQSAPNRKNFIAIAGGALIILALIVNALNRENLTSPILEKPYQSETLAFTGNSPHAALSPNGKYVVYVYGKNDKESIWVKNIETGNNVEIISPTSDKYFGLVFSQDNEQIYLSRKSVFEEPVKVFKVSILGGRLIKILDDVQGWIAVSPDDRQISFVRYTKKDGEHCALWIADANGKNQRKLVSRSDGIDIGDNEWSPDGKRIIFANGHAHNASQFYGVSEVEVETGKERNIIQNKFFIVKSLQFLRDNESFLMSGMESVEEPTRIWQVSTTTGEITQITKTNESYQSLSLSQNQDKLVAVTLKSDFKLYSHETQNPNNFRVLTEAETFTVSAENKIYFSSKIGGNAEIWSMNLDGSQQKQLTTEKGRDFVPIVSRNGLYVFFTSSRSGTDQLWRMNADGTNQLQITQTEGGYPISADEQFVYYRAISKVNLWKVPIDGGEESLVLDKRSQYFAITKDHSKVAYLEKKDGLKYLMVHSLIDGNEVNSVQIEKSLTAYLLNWIQDDNALALIFQDDKTKDFNFQKVEFKPSELNKIINLGQKGVFHNAGFWLSPDGNNLMLIRGEYKTDVIFLQGLN